MKDILSRGITRKVLCCVKENGRTVEEIWKEYQKIYPRSYIGQKIFGQAILFTTISALLDQLYRNDYVERNITRFTTQALKVDSHTYCLSRKGRSALLPKGKKT